MVNEVSNSKVQVLPTVRAVGAASPDSSGKDSPVSGAADSVQVSGAAKANQADVVDAMKKMQVFAQTVSRDLNFSVDEESGETIIRVIDSKTDEVVRQIPSEEALRIARALDDGSGFLMETEA